MAIGKCILCDYEGDENEHHCTVPDVPSGYAFILDGKRYMQDKPSLTIYFMAYLTGTGTNRTFYLVRPTGDVPLVLDNAIDLRTTPELYSIPPATY